MARLNENHLWDILRDGAWKGRRCFLVGCGPSLKGFDWEQLRGELTIAINRSFMDVPDPSLTLSMDMPFWGWVTGGHMGDEVKEKFENMDCPRVYANTYNWDLPDYLYTLMAYATGQGLSRSMRDGIYCGRNSGFAALNLAICLGANPIYLLGYDMKGETKADGSGTQSWYHAPHPKTYDWESEGGDIYKELMIPHFEAAVPVINEIGVEVVNLNPDSALRCFDFASCAEALAPISRPVVVSFFTKDTGYEAEAENLRRSCRMFNLDYDIVPTDSLGSWKANTSYKPRFIQKMMEKYEGRSVLWVDSDAVFNAYPSLFDDLEGFDMACHFFVNREVSKGNIAIRPKHLDEAAQGQAQGGTLYFAPTAPARAFVSAWIEDCEANQHRPFTDQSSLNVLLRDKFPVRLLEIPVEYCTIFDQLWETCQEPIIEHFQASRRLKEAI